MNKDDAQRKIREAAAEGRIEFTSQEGIESFDEEFVRDFLARVVMSRTAWISDSSRLSDFGDRANEAHERIGTIYGIDVRPMDNILEIFRAIHAHNRTIQ